MTVPGFRAVPRTGVIYVMHRAGERGFFDGRSSWANLGQGAPEVGPMPGSPPRITEVDVSGDRSEYAPVGGTRALRERVAGFYNAVHRRGRASQYTAANVSIAPGGRAAMTRVAAALGPINMGHFIPDYTAYEELLTTFRGFVPIPILNGDGEVFDAEALEREILGRGLGALLFSNPRNPTGKVVEELGEWTRLARRHACTMIVDEFYSHYRYGAHESFRISAAEHVDDVDTDPVIVVDGLTKNWRYPGWRISWILGPTEVIERVNSAGSFLDGGANHAFQDAAVDLLEPGLAEKEAGAIQSVFAGKRVLLIDGLRELGIRVDPEPAGAFYVWGDLSGLPAPLGDGMRLFEAGLEERLVTVPGTFFDVNPGQRRAHGRYRSYSRFSYGPPGAELERGLEALARMIRR
jgi:hypothetical protein